MAETNHAIENASAWYESIKSMLEVFDKADEENRDEAQARIEESPLSVCVRSAAFVPVGEVMDADEYEILLTTGGPALRIIGELDNNYPKTARLEWQDWGTPWTVDFSVNEETLLRYAQFFFFGEQ
jgi:hypothetical protein